MTGSDIAARFAFGLELVKEAGDFALDYFNRREQLTIRNKGLQDVVSEADLNTELLIKRRLAERFAEDGFLGEETGVTELAPGQGVWVVDPIDGTQPFVSGMASWCVSMAFLVGDELKFGMVYAPVRGELFSGGIGFPATLNGKPIAGHAGTTLGDGICGTGYSTRIPVDTFLPMLERFLRQGGMFYRDGSGALMLCDVACGRLLGYVESHINSWDCLGAIAVIKAAGLQTSDFLADDGLHKGNRLVAGNANVFPMLDALWR
ncbi:inositol monophosphatase [Pelomonas sp. KK5]|uniref:inositol monophosphatase family protein n=1 Tax=Pelomonas sp. KK5 TaxID=1855730 RepID=UPI00097CB8E1|nr:inositol monophosphatase [Pelomonas sp. KK5]